MGTLYFSDQVVTANGEAFVQVRDGGKGKECYFGVIESFSTGEALAANSDVVVAFANKLIEAARVARDEEERPARPTIVCLCGSTRFWREFQRASLAETLAGRIVLSIGAASGTDDEHFGNLPPEEYARIKEDLDQLHLRKVEMADEVLILNVDGYVGESTARELAHAFALGKRIRFLEPEIGKVKVALEMAAQSNHG